MVRIIVFACAMLGLTLTAASAQERLQARAVLEEAAGPLSPELQLALESEDVAQIGLLLPAIQKLHEPAGEAETTGSAEGGSGSTNVEGARNNLQLGRLATEASVDSVAEDLEKIVVLCADGTNSCQPREATAECADGSCRCTAADACGEMVAGGYCASGTVACSALGCSCRDTRAPMTPVRALQRAPN